MKQRCFPKRFGNTYIIPQNVSDVKGFGLKSALKFAPKYLANLFTLNISDPVDRNLRSRDSLLIDTHPFLMYNYGVPIIPHQMRYMSLRAVEDTPAH